LRGKTFPLCYNLRMKCKLVRMLCLAFVMAGAGPTFGQASGPARPVVPASQGIFLVFPFENDGANARLDWLCEGLEELTIQRLSAAGQKVFTHAGRTTELDRYGLPANAQFSHATMLRIGADLDADFVVFGKFSSDGKSLTIEARALRVNPTRLSEAVRESGTLDSLMELNAKVVWKLLAANDKGFPINLAEFSRLQRPLRLDAFEHYIRGLLATDDDGRVRELRESTRLDPDWVDPAFALGQAYFSRRDCESALAWLAKVPAGSSLSAEAMFTTGVCRMMLNQPDKAEETFAALQNNLRNDLVAGAELPEVLNNLALVRARRGNTTAAASALLRALDLDPDEDDYAFNLGLLYLRGNDATTAAKYFREASDREPENPEDRAMLVYALEKTGNKTEAAQERNSAIETLGLASLPPVKPESFARLDRVSTELDVTTLQLQIASRDTNGSTSGGAASSAMSSPTSLVRRGRQELAAGRVDAAEADFRTALAAAPNDPAAHRGMAEVLRRRSKRAEAIQELQAALSERDSAVDRTTLARIYLEQKKPEMARAELQKALKIAPNYSEARQLLELLQNGNGKAKTATP
jgi:tetratricopeptide (TPR) repeat protein